MEERKLLHERSTGHALVGIFVLAAVLVFGWLLMSQWDRTERYRLVAEFNTISNLGEATNIKLRGFTIGRVERIDFQPQPDPGEAFFLVELGIESRYPVYVGTVAEIHSSGLVGETFINLNVSQTSDEKLKPGSHLRGQDAVGMKQVIESIGDMAHKLGGAGENIRRADLGYKLGRLGDSMQRVAMSLEKVSYSADSLLVTSRQMVENIGPGTERVLTSLEENLDQLNQTIRHTDTLVTASQQDVQKSVKAMRQVVERLDRVLQRIDSMVESKQVEIDETLENLHAASQAVREVSEHPWKLITGQGKKADGESDEKASPP